MARLGSICGRWIEFGTRKGKGEGWTHGLAVEVVLGRHDAVDGLRFLEREERKASRAVRFGIAHDGAVRDLAELLKVRPERVCVSFARSEACVAIEGRNDQPSVVSQLSPPMNIFLQVRRERERGNARHEKER